MASLTGNKIKDTYTSLLKVGDNAAIDSSAQALTDGAGNALGLTLTNTGIIVSTAKGTLLGTSSTGEVSSTLIADNAVDATRLNVSGNGTSGQAILSDGDGTFSYGSSGKTTEEIQDIVGAMTTSNTETNITVTYQDSDGTLDFVVDAAQPNVTSLGTLTSLLFFSFGSPFIVPGFFTATSVDSRT